MLLMLIPVIGSLILLVIYALPGTPGPNRFGPDPLGQDGGGRSPNVWDADDESFTVAEGGTATQVDLDEGESLLEGDTDADLPHDTLTVDATGLSAAPGGSGGVSPVHCPVPGRVQPCGCDDPRLAAHAAVDARTWQVDRLNPQV